MVLDTIRHVRLEEASANASPSGCVAMGDPAALPVMRKGLAQTASEVELLSMQGLLRDVDATVDRARSSKRAAAGTHGRVAVSVSASNLHSTPARAHAPSSQLPPLQRSNPQLPRVGAAWAGDSPLTKPTGAKGRVGAAGDGERADNMHDRSRSPIRNPMYSPHHTSKLAGWAWQTPTLAFPTLAFRPCTHLRCA